MRRGKPSRRTSADRLTKAAKMTERSPSPLSLSLFFLFFLLLFFFLFFFFFFIGE